MAENIFEKWDKEIDVESLKGDIAKVAEDNKRNRDFKTVPHGTYEVAIEQMELKSSKKGDPMISIWFRVVDGEFKKSLIFMNQVITKDFQIHIVNNLLRKMTSEMDEPPVIDFESYTQYANLVMDIFEVVADNYEYALKYTANARNKDFSDFEIVDVFPLED